MEEAENAAGRASGMIQRIQCQALAVARAICSVLVTLLNGTMGISTPTGAL